MPITTEDEPEDGDEEAPSRVNLISLLRVITGSHFIYSLLSASSTRYLQACLHLRFSLLSELSSSSTSNLQSLLVDEALFLPLASPSKDAVNS